MNQTTILLEEFDNGIAMKITDDDPNSESVHLVFKDEEKAKSLGAYILEELKYIQDEHLCNKVKLTIQYEPIIDES